MSIKQLAMALSLALAEPAIAQEEHHDHAVPERLGAVHFKTSCTPAVGKTFDRAVALLHSFAYSAADKDFANVAKRDPACAMAYWGRAMTKYHQLWEPPAGADLAAGANEIEKAAAMVTGLPRERGLISALELYYTGAKQATPAARALRYSEAMASVAQKYRDDDEVQVFYALSLLATALPTDRTHERQKQAATILEPIWKRQPDHPGAPHYLIHAYDSAELAERGLAAARAYSGIAPSAPHALHMPSHIFTRLGLWDDSVRSNIASRKAAHAEGDTGEELHAMDYLTYAYLQLGRTADAASVVSSLANMGTLGAAGFKIGYAANAMPVRLAVETRDWAAAARISPLPGSAAQVAAIVWWARALGRLRAATPGSADADIAQLQVCHNALLEAGNTYWAQQVDVLLKSGEGWRAEVAGNAGQAVQFLSAAADEEDTLEKLPLTPGPIVPAREQLGELELLLDRPKDALAAFEAALALAPGRHGALGGAAEATRRLHAE